MRRGTRDTVPAVEYYCLAKRGFKTACEFVEAGSVEIDSTGTGFTYRKAEGTFDPVLPGHPRVAAAAIWAGLILFFGGFVLVGGVAKRLE